MLNSNVNLLGFQKLTIQRVIEEMVVRIVAALSTPLQPMVATIVRTIDTPSANGSDSQDYQQAFSQW